MLKHLADDEQRAKAQEVAAVYKKLFAEKKWEAVLGKMQRVVDEDNLRVVQKRRPTRLLQAGQALFAKSPTNASRTATTPLSRARAPSTTRERWDVLSRAPATPLSPTPTGNAFANGGFWEQLTPKTPGPKTPVPKTPLTAIGPASPFSPVIPQDAEARSAYKHVKNEVDAMARSICGNRMSVHSTVPSDSEDVPKTLLSAKDVLKAAEITLEYHQLPLFTSVNPALPKVLEGLARDEKAITSKFTVKDSLQLLDVDAWLCIDQDPFDFYTILDAQRDRTRMLHHRRKSKSLELSEQAVQQAWATRILEDAERAYDFDREDDNGSDNSDETSGYDYSNFLRSIKSSTSDLTNMEEPREFPDLALLRSSAMSRETTFTSQRSSTSPRKIYDQSGTLELSRESTFASHGNSPRTSPTKPYNASLRSSTSPCKPPSLPRQSKRNTLEEIESSIHVPSRDSTHTQDYDTPQLSPEDRAFRRKGASVLELDKWAQELKMMEDRQKIHKEALMAQGYPVFRKKSRTSDAKEKQRGDHEGASGHGRMKSAPSKNMAEGKSDLPFRRYAGSAHRSPRHSSQPQSISNDLPFRQLHTRADSNIPAPSTGSPPVRSSPTRIPPPLPPLQFEYASPSQTKHVRCKSSSARVEDEWGKELEGMEGRERERQRGGEMEQGE
jgi:hypothetical protein